MKILILSDPRSTHTLKWANAINETGISVSLFGLNIFESNLFNNKIDIETASIPHWILNKNEGSFSKLIYLASYYKIKSLIKKIKPDILHAHYVSSYGLLGALTGFHPYLISVWGSDIFNFPQKSVFHKKLIEFTLSKADKILSTSNIMAHETNKYTDKEIGITPFGIDVEKFVPRKRSDSLNKETIVIGTIKTLEKKYGIEYLIRAFKLVEEKIPDQKFKLLLVGGGSLKKYLEQLTIKLNIKNDVQFTGFVSPEVIPDYHNMLDIYVASSIEESESFGVAILEAMACEKPVIVTNVGGLPEIVENNKNAIIVERKNVNSISEAIIKLVMDSNLREQMGKAARQHVINNYNWKSSVNKMVEIYETLTRRD